MNEQQIIQQMQTLYSHCRSYEDQGMIETITDPGTATERHERVQFRTAFLRPMFFRFEWKNSESFTGKPQDTETVWCDGRTSYSKNRFDTGVEEFDSLDHAIAGAIGVCAHIVSSLLMPGVLSFRFMRDGELGSMPPEKMYNEDCYHLVAKSPELRTDILINAKSFALMRIREERILKSGQINLPAMPPDMSPEEREEMVAVLTEAAEDLHTITDCTYTRVTFDSPIPESVFQLPIT